MNYKLHMFDKNKKKALLMICKFNFNEEIGFYSQFVYHNDSKYCYNCYD